MSQPAKEPAEKAAPAAPVLLREDANGVTTLTLNRPKQRNSLSEELMIALTREIEAVGNDASIRAVVLAGAGPGFCAGHDLKELTAARVAEDRGRAFFAKTMKLCSTLMQAIVNCPKPVIARVHGIATAAGCQLVASCDLAVAADEAKFATPGVNITKHRPQVDIPPGRRNHTGFIDIEGIRHHGTDVALGQRENTQFPIAFVEAQGIHQGLRYAHIGTAGRRKQAYVATGTGLDG